MRVLYVHPNHPAQFGHIAEKLAGEHGWRCWHCSETPGGVVRGVEKIQYKLAGGATARTHFCSRTFENGVWHCDAVYAALKARPDVTPDLIVGHSGFGSTLFLRELYPGTPIVNLFEYYYRPHDPLSDMDFRRDLGWPVDAAKYQRSRCRNAMILLDLQNCDAAYAPTEFQRDRFPAEYREKLQVLFDGVDRSVYHGHDDALRPAMGERKPRGVAGVTVAPRTRIVTYVSRGFESLRGFDIFIRAARRIMERFGDVHFFVVGSDRIAYGGDAGHIAPHATFAQWTLAHHPIDPRRLTFLGRLAPGDLGRLLAASDLHLYLTAPFVLSWSMMDAMSCGAVVLGSDTPPVAEMIEEGRTGLLTDFFDVERWADRAIEVLGDPDAFRGVGRAAERMIAEKYSLEVMLPRMMTMCERAVAGGSRSA